MDEEGGVGSHEDSIGNLRHIFYDAFTHSLARPRYSSYEIRKPLIISACLFQYHI